MWLILLEMDFLFMKPMIVGLIWLKIVWLLAGIDISPDYICFDVVIAFFLDWNRDLAAGKFMYILTAFSWNPIRWFCVVAELLIFLEPEMQLLELKHVILCVRSMFRLGNKFLVAKIDELLVKNEPRSRQNILPKICFLYHFEGVGKKCFCGLKIA